MLYNIAVSKINTVEQFDTAKLPEASINYLIEYGLKQSVNDAHAGCTEKTFPVETERLAEATKRVAVRVEQIRSGQVPRSTGVDPMWVAAAEAGVTREAMMEFIAAQAAKGKKHKAA